MQATTTAPSTTTTTLAPLRGQLPPPVTLPFITKAQSAHFAPYLAKLSLAGLALTLLILLVQFILTRPGRPGGRTF